jgi:gamma-glutamylcyclotransferase (GGCT)/AIG2-like uncharacterized protein YtfP
VSSEAAAGTHPEPGAPPRLFVYGSLRAGETNEMAALLRASSRHLGRGTVCGRLYAVDWYPGMVASDDAQDCVAGDVFELHPSSAGRVLADLDAYEGDGFARRIVRVRMDRETCVSAFAYLFAGSAAGRRGLAAGRPIPRNPSGAPRGTRLASLEIAVWGEIEPV